MSDRTIDRYLVIGNPVAHSLSPLIHAEFARLSGQVLSYGRERCAEGGFAALLRTLLDTGLRGCNVTVPFKFDALQAATQRSARAALAGAANTLWVDAAGAVQADNTDGVGLVRDIESGAGVAIEGRRVLLIGAGGAAAGVLGPLLAARPASLVLCNRSADRADALAAGHREWAATHGARLQTASIGSPFDGVPVPYDVVINATASSLHGAASPVPATVLAQGTLAVDLMYGDAAAPFLAWAQDSGATGRDGLGMLVEQAAESFQVWRGVRPPTAPVLAMLREHLALQKAAR